MAGTEGDDARLRQQLAEKDGHVAMLRESLADTQKVERELRCVLRDAIWPDAVRVVARAGPRPGI